MFIKKKFNAEAWKELQRIIFKAIETGDSKKARDTGIEADDMIRHGFNYDALIEGEAISLDEQEIDKWLELNIQEGELEQSIFKGQRFIKHEKDNSRKARMLLRLENLELALKLCRFNADEIIKQ